MIELNTFQANNIKQCVPLQEELVVDPWLNLLRSSCSLLNKHFQRGQEWMNLPIIRDPIHAKSWKSLHLEAASLYHIAHTMSCNIYRVHHEVLVPKVGAVDE